MKTERIENYINNMKDREGKDMANNLVERLNSISFWELLTETSKIQIPIIQRDYAQGRENEKTNKIRDKFLRDIIEVLNYPESKNGNKKIAVPLELDFVYGNIENDVFQPLDGQQRLTTLFLLHWYIASRTDNLSIAKKHFLKFTYETRISSREFCTGLVENGEFLGKGKTISEKISDSGWFFLTWEKDPTIKAMLIMLDSIEERLKEKDKELLAVFWQKLTSLNPPITFYFKQLNDIGLTDDLYIKMNARGKALTDFENFKAKFEQYIIKVIYKTNDKGAEIIENGEKIILKDDWEKDLKNPQETFSHKVDTVWSDLFWKHRGEDNIIDNEITKFIAGVAINFYAESIEILENKELDLNIKKEFEEKSKGKTVTNEAISRERVERRIAQLFNNPGDVNPEDFVSKNAFDYLKQCFEIYSKNSIDELLPANLPLWEYCENKKVKINNDTETDNTLFIELISDRVTTYKQRVLFYAQTKYLINPEAFDSESFSNWLRVSRNIVQNSTIDSSNTFIGAIGLINEIASGCKQIYQYLSSNSITSGFAFSQTAEEILKSKIMSNDNKKVIIATEDTSFCKGKIGFALYCIDFEHPEDNFDIMILSDIHKSIDKHLSETDITNDFRRGLFTVKENKFYDYWDTSWLYAVSAPKRCLIKDVSELKAYAYNLRFRDNLKELLIQLTKIELPELLHNYIIPDKMPKWKARIIKEHGLLDFSNRHFIAVKEDECCWLIPQGKVSNSKEGASKCKLIK
jgi:hypothetical protein